MIFNSVEHYADEFNHYQRVQPGDVQRVAETYLQPNNRSVVILTPEVKNP